MGSATGQRPVNARADDPREARWRVIRRWAVVAYVAALVAFSLTVGVPENRIALLGWILAGLGIRCLGRGWRSFGRVLLDWLPFTAVLLVYDYSRGFADKLGIATHVTGPARADEWLFGGTLPTFWLQQRLYTPGQPHWYDVVVTIVYTSHFMATPIIAFVLWIRNRPRWIAFISRIIALSFAGLATYIFYPAAPPWLAAEKGVIPPVVRISNHGWLVLHLSHAGNVLAQAQLKVNTVAAMPSVHTATATIIALFFIRRVPWWGKILLSIYPLLMGAVLVYSGEHYVVDLLFGYVYAIVIMGAFALGRRWWNTRRARPAPP